MYKLTMSVKLPQGIHDGKVPIARQGSQGEDRYPNGHILHELREAAEEAAIWPILHGVNGGCQWHCGHNNQKIRQG